jgi:Sulfotransferase domain
MQQVVLAKGHVVEFDIRDDPKGEVSFIFGVRKSGSSLFNSMMNSLAGINDVNYVDIAEPLFKTGILEKDWRVDPSLLDLLRPGNIYGGFRAMPLIMYAWPDFPQCRKVLLVRDPRDAVVSEYFSNAYSHSVPEGTSDNATRDMMLQKREAALRASLTEFVLNRAREFNRTMVEYEAVARDPLTRVYKYEEVIFDKRGWLADIASHFGWSPGSHGFIEGMMSWADVRPETEDATQFVRRVTPGDHREKLPDETVQKLTSLLEPSMRLFGYRAD